MTTTYAVGDVHGSYTQLAELIERHKETGHHLVFLGDLFDRSPEPDGDRKVYELITDLYHSPSSYGLAGITVLRGNHEQLLLDAAQHGDRDLDCWLANGGDPEFLTYMQENKRLDWVKDLPYIYTCGKYLLVHAGVRPGIPLEKQSADDLIWIRPDPLEPHNLDKVVVHGHTIHEEITYYPDRIAIDTGCFYTGVLSELELV